MRIVRPNSLVAPRGYNHGILVEGGALLFLAGQIGCTGDGRLVGDGFAAQFEQALANLLQVVDSAGGTAGSVTKLTIFVTDRTEYLAQLKEVGQAYRRQMGMHFPAMTFLEVKNLLEPGARVEIEGLAVIQDTRGA